MAEWFKAAVLKTVERKLRGFESYSLRQISTAGTALYHPRADPAKKHTGRDNLRLDFCVVIC